jgi:transcriptional regulator with XRE-family HTH domain
MGAMDRKTYRRTYIRQWRDRLGITQEELADRAGLSYGYISLLETGKRGYTQDSLERIAHELRCTPGELLNVDPTRDASFMGLVETLKPHERRQAEDLVRLFVQRRNDPREAD